MRAVLEGKNNKGVLIKILINSAPDTVEIIKGLKQLKDINKGYDILISSVRDEGSSPASKSVLARYPFNKGEGL